MAEAASRIEAASSFREAEGGASSGQLQKNGSKKAQKKAAARLKAVEAISEPIEPDRAEDSDKHELDTLA
jgi:hypothetical protein